MSLLLRVVRDMRIRSLIEPHRVLSIIGWMWVDQSGFADSPTSTAWHSRARLRIGGHILYPLVTVKCILYSAALDVRLIESEPSSAFCKVLELRQWKILLTFRLTANEWDQPLLDKARSLPQIQIQNLSMNTMKQKQRQVHIA